MPNTFHFGALPFSVLCSFVLGTSESIGLEIQSGIAIFYKQLIKK